MQEQDLLAGALAGDRRCWQALIARHERKLIVSLLARGLPLDRAREVAQETWTRLMESQRAGRLTHLTLPGLAIVQAGYLAGSDWRRQPREAGPLEPAALPRPAGTARRIGPSIGRRSAGWRGPWSSARPGRGGCSRRCTRTRS